MTRSMAEAPVAGAGPGPDYAVWLPRLLKLTAGYLLVALLALMARVELSRWGFPIRDNGHPVLLRAFLFHGLSGIVALMAWWPLRERILIPNREFHSSVLSPQSSASARRAACRVLLVSAPVLLLISADLLLSVEFPPPPLNERSVFMRDAKLIWRLRPGARGTRGGYPVEINAHGLRGPDVPYGRQAAEYRILFLGDSTTLGYGYAWEETFVARSQALLPRVHGKRVTAINAGIDGYTAWQELGFLTDEGIRYGPDLVVLGFCLNDLTDYGRSFIVYAGGRWLGKSGIFRALQYWRHGPRGDLVHGRQRGFAPPIIEDLFAAEESEVTRAGWAEALGDIEKMRSVCAERGIEFVLLYIPAQAQVIDPAHFDDRPQRRLAAFAAEHGISLLDPLPRLLSLGPEVARACFMDNWHLSAKGHAVVADVLVEKLSRPRP